MLAIPHPAHSLQQLTRKYEDQTGRVTSDHDWGRAAAVEGRGRTCAELRMRWGSPAPRGRAQGWGESVTPSHSQEEGQRGEEKPASFWLRHSAHHSAGDSAATQIVINFDKKRFPSAFLMHLTYLL